MKEKKNLRKLLSMLLCCIMVLGILPVTALAANTEGNFRFGVDKNVVQGGSVAPGTETFTFELAYGTVGENNQHSVVFTPSDSITLADCGITFTNNTITTNGAGVKTEMLGGTIDLNKVNAEHHWQPSTGDDSVTKNIITLRLTEKNDGKTGWTYSDAERYLTITVKNGEISTDVHLLGNDVEDNNFENTYTGRTVILIEPSIPEETNPSTGAMVDAPQTNDNSNMILWIALLLISAFGVTGAVVYSKRKKYTE